MKGTATVVKNSGSHYLLSELPSWELFPAVLRGKLRLQGSRATNPVAVGDVVDYEADGEITEENPATITEIHDRRNAVVRRPSKLSSQSHIIAANLDQACIVSTLYFPEIKLPFLDRILVSCEAFGVHPIIVLNKVDLYRDFAPDELKRFHEIYEGAGYRVIETSAISGEGVDELREACIGRLSLFSGESGVGKSSLIKALDSSLNPKIARISESHLTGCHTTSLYEMYRLSCGGYIVDSPGLRGFGLVQIEKEETALYFPEMLRVSRDCRFTPCTHTHEPGCAVKAAVDEGIISPERYNSYLGMLEEYKKFR